MMIKIGEFILAPRPRYSISKETINVTLRDGSTNSAPLDCASGECGDGQIKNSEIVFTVRCLGSNDHKAADFSYRQLEIFLNTLCKDNIQQYHRVICDEAPLVYWINGGYIRRVDMEWDWENGVRSGEVHLTTIDIDDEAPIILDSENLLPAGG